MPRAIPDVPVAVSGLTRRFGDAAALSDVTFSVRRGTILGVIGPSGSGKTTLIRILTGTLEKSEGSVAILGEDPRKFRRQTREQIGYMPQLFILYPDLTVSENVSFVASLFGLLWNRRRRRVREVLQFVGLWDDRRKRAKDLSGGMQRRLELACTLVHEPRILFVDEPTAGLDPMLRQTIWDEFRRMREDGRTLVVTTQYVAEAEYCDLVAVIAEGQLIALETPEQLRHDALGGEVVQVETQRPVDARSLVNLEGVVSIRQPAPRELRIVVEDAGAATPRILSALAAQDVEVVSSSEYHPTFDEVFTELVSRKQAESQPQPEPGTSEPKVPARAA